jgi:predicted secreted protein
MPYLRNDIQRTMITVALEDVPTSSSFRAQQLNALSESIKAMPAEQQQVVFPFMVDLMDLPRKKDVVEALRASSGQADPEAIREQVKQELMHDLKERELALREREIAAKEAQYRAQAVNTGVTSTFAAMQAAEKIAMNPAIAPVGDIVLKQAGWQPPNPEGSDPNIPAPVVTAPIEQPGGLPGDTTPTTPDVPTSADMGANEGIETLRMD